MSNLVIIKFMRYILYYIHNILLKFEIHLTLVKFRKRFADLKKNDCYF